MRDNITIEKVLLAAGLGLVTYFVLFRTPNPSSPPKQIASGEGPSPSFPPLPPRWQRTEQVEAPPNTSRKPVAMGKVYLLSQDARALVDASSVRFADNKMQSARQEGAGSVRIFAPGEIVFASDADLSEGRFYAAETEALPQGLAITGFKRYYTGSGENLKAMLKSVGDRPDYDPYTDQAFSEQGEQIRQALSKGQAATVTMNSLAPQSPYRYDAASSRIPPSFARRMR